MISMPLLARRVDFGVRAFDGGGDDDGVDAGEMRGVVSDVNGDAAAGQEGRGRGAFEIASGDGYPAPFRISAMPLIPIPPMPTK